MLFPINNTLIESFEDWPLECRKTASRKQNRENTFFILILIFMDRQIIVGKVV
jgi:hypothetical protein